MNWKTTTAAGLLAVAGLVDNGNAQTPAPAAAAPKTWVDSVTFKGDLRYRYESIEDDSKLDADKDTYTRERQRIRARLGLEAKANDSLKLGIEMSTGGEDPVSGNQTIGGGFNKEEMRLSLAYGDYSFLGDSPHELHAIAGKMKNPFITHNDDLMWDGDLTPEGVALKGQWGEDKVTLFANGGYMWVEERSDTDDTMLYAGQGAVKFGFTPEVSLTLGAGYYTFDNVEGYDVIDWEKKNNAYGNSTTRGSISGGTTNKAWASEFTPVVYFAELVFWVAGKPVSLFSQYLDNTDADDLSEGNLYGISIGKAKNPQTWEIGYSFAKLEKDATLGMFTDSDRWGGGTDGEGHKVYGKYQLKKNLQFGVTYFMDEKGISGDSEKDYQRLQVDLVANF